VRLGARGKVEGTLVDTLHFRGNFPREIMVHGVDFGEKEVEFTKEEWEMQDWVEVLGETKMKADTEFSFRGGELKNVQDRLFTHMRLTIIPDGGVKRFRVFGTKA
jgi:allantoicase